MMIQSLDYLRRSFYSKSIQIYSKRIICLVWVLILQLLTVEDAEEAAEITLLVKANYQ